MAGAAPVRGRPDGDRGVRRPRRLSPGAAAAAVERQEPGARVRRQVLPGRALDGRRVRPRVRQLRRPAAVRGGRGGGRGRRAGAADPGRRRLPLRGPGALPGRRRDLVRAGDGAAAAGRRPLPGGLPRRRRHGGAPGDRRGTARRIGGVRRRRDGVLVRGAQFFAFPTPSPDGTQLAWISWNHPNMPWDGTELRVAPLGWRPGHGRALDACHGRSRRVGARTGLAR